MPSLKSSFRCDLLRLVCGSCFYSTLTQIIRPTKVVTVSVSIRLVSRLDLELQIDHDNVAGIKLFFWRCVQGVKMLAQIAE